MINFLNIGSKTIFNYSRSKKYIYTPGREPKQNKIKQNPKKDVKKKCKKVGKKEQLEAP